MFGFLQAIWGDLMAKLIVSEKYTTTRGEPLIIAVNPLLIKMMRMSRRMGMSIKKVPLNTYYSWTSVGTFSFTVQQTGYYDLWVYGGGGGGGGLNCTNWHDIVDDGWGGTIDYSVWTLKRGGGGGGSGNYWTRVYLTKGQVITVTVGSGGAAGVDATFPDAPWTAYCYILGQNWVYPTGTQPATVGTNGSQGGTSSFGGYSVSGGLGGQSGNYGGNASAIPPGGSNQGNISTAGTNGAVVNFNFLSSAPAEINNGAAGGFGNNSNQSETAGHGGKGGGSVADYETHQMRYAAAYSAPTAGNNGAIWLKLASYT